MTMVRVFPALLTLLVVSTLPGGRQARGQGKSTLEIGAVQKAKFGSGAQLHIGAGTQLREWELRGSGVKELTVRLLVAVNGKSKLVQQEVYQWQKPRPDARLELLLLVQDGEPFGAKNKHLPSFAVRAKGLPVEASSSKREPTFLEGPFAVGVGADRFKGPVAPGKPFIVQWDLLGGTTDAKIGSVDDLVEATKGRRSGLILVLEWTSDAGGK
jgi:hypothetical protein